MDNSGDQNLFQLYPNYMRTMLSSFDMAEDLEDPDGIEYGGGFLPFNCHPNRIAMRQRLKEVNDQWNAGHPEKTSNRKRAIRVRFNAKIEMFLIPPEEDEDYNSNTTENDHYSDSSGNEETLAQLPVSSNDASAIIQTFIEYQIQEINLKLNEVEATRSSEAAEVEYVETVFDVTNIEENSAEIDGGLQVEEPYSPVLARRGPVPIPEVNASNTGNPKKASGDVAPDHCISVIRAIFNPKTLAALLKLQEPKLLPLVRTQIQKKKVLPDLLHEIFSDKFLKLIFDEKSRDAGIEKFKTEGVTDEVFATMCKSLQPTDGGIGKWSKPEAGEIQVKVRSKPGDRGETPGKFRTIVPTLKDMLGTDDSVQTPLNLRHHVRGGGGDPSPYPDQIHLRRARPKTKSASPAASVPSRFPKSSHRPTSLNSAGKAKQKDAERTVEENKASRKYPLVDTDWLERKIKQDAVAPSAGAVTSTPKKKVAYNWNGRHYIVDATPPKMTETVNLSRQNSSTRINSEEKKMSGPMGNHQ